jgi:hypothetical protein
MKRALSYRQEKYCSKNISEIEHNHFKTLLLLLPNELLKIILSFCGIIEHHMLRLVCKDIHISVHDYNASKMESTLRGHFFYRHFFYGQTFSGILISVTKEIDMNILILMKELLPGIFSPTCADYCSSVAMVGRLDILKWARENECPWNEYTCAMAAKGGHLEILKWARENGCRWDFMTCTAAAEEGHLEVLKWARENNCPWNEDTCSYAAKGGHLEILKWARKNGCPWNEKTCSGAAFKGQLEILKWSRENGCPWDEWTSFSAAEGGHSEISKWASENGCP